MIREMAHDPKPEGLPPIASGGIWDGQYKIPWNDQDFSRRMLAEHLAQNHDMASRRFEWIDRQVDWIHHRMLSGRPAAILDLGCGPGFYSHRLTTRGHRCRGIDFGPAAIDYAREHNPDRLRCEFVLGDIRRIAFGGPYDLVMLLFGEMNVFAPDEVADILHRAQASIASRRGRLIVEIQTPAAVERGGRSAPLEEESSSGLFSDHPYRCRTESRWLPDERVAIQTFTIAGASAGATRTYRNTTKAWSEDELTLLLHTAGFGMALRQPEWPCNTDALALWSAAAA